MIDLTQIESLSLYYYQACPYCAVTRQFLDNVDLDIEQRDILLHPKHRSELIKQGGKPQVPCLRIDAKNGASEWLYESADILEFIGQFAGQTAYADMA